MANADEKLFLWINSLVGKTLAFDTVVRWLVSDYLIPVLVCLSLLFLWFIGEDKRTRLQHQVGVFVALSSMSLSSLVVFAINVFYFRPRPFMSLDVTLLFYRPTDSSFPANSIAAVFGIAFAVWSVNKKLGTLLIGASLLMAFARVAAGVHYPGDVIAGILVACVATCVIIQIRKLLGPIPVWVIKLARTICLA